jgi:hypothetical protein
MWYKNGKTSRQPTKHRQTSKRSFQQNTHGKINKQTHRKTIQSQCNGRTSRGNGRTDSNHQQKSHLTNGSPHKEHNQGNERDDADPQKQKQNSGELRGCNKNGEIKETRQETQKIQQSTNLQTLWKEAPIQKGGQMLGTRGKKIVPSEHLEINYKHLKVRRAHNRNRDVAIRKSVDK